AAVVVRGVDHDALGKAGVAQLQERLRDRVLVVVRRALAAAQDHVTVGVALRVEDRRRTADVDAREGMRRRSRAAGTAPALGAAGGAVLDPDRHREARGELAVDLALGGPGPDR